MWLRGRQETRGEREGYDMQQKVPRLNQIIDGAVM